MTQKELNRLKKGVVRLGKEYGYNNILDLILGSEFLDEYKNVIKYPLKCTTLKDKEVESRAVYINSIGEILKEGVNCYYYDMRIFDGELKTNINQITIEDLDCCTRGPEFTESYLTPAGALIGIKHWQNKYGLNGEKI